MRMRGFTLIELIMVITITGIMAASVTIFLVPAIQSYLDTTRRADLTDMADTALRRMSQDIRRAVPNSINYQSATCIGLVPTVSGGRYRREPDTFPSAARGSKWIDTALATSAFDVLNVLDPIPAVGDWVVIGNQLGSDVYNNVNRAAITSVVTPPVPAPVGLEKILGQHRIIIASKQFPVGYDGGRFVIVANTEQAVYYSKVGSTLYRNITTFAAPACGAVGSVVATDVQNLTFIYSPNAGATQQSGFVWMRLELGRAGENVALAHGVHVDNVP